MKLLSGIKRFIRRKGSYSLNFDEKAYLEKNSEEFDKLEKTGNPVVKKIITALKNANKKQGRSELRIIRTIEQLRKELSENKNPLSDGTEGEGGIYDKDVSISKACSVSKPLNQALNLFHLIKELQPNIIIELGTNIGISSAYLGSGATANGKGKIYTHEASAYRIKIAKSLHNKTGLTNINYVNGLFTDTLKDTLETVKEVDFAFIDGHHQYQPTLDYYRLVHNFATENAVFIFDDIRWSDGMLQAWNEISSDEYVKYTLDLGAVGIIITSKSIRTDKPPVFIIQ